MLGLFAGFSDSIAGEAVMRVLDVFFAFPMVLLAIAISSVLGPGMMNAMLSVSIVLIPYMTRVVYTATLQERSLQLIGRPFEEATILQAARAYERATDWHNRHPAL